MHRYEILLLTSPEITGDEASGLESTIDKVVEEAKGTTISFERWGKYHLAYQVQKHAYGVYFLARFEVEDPKPLLDALDSLFKIKLSNIVMRFMVTALSPKQSLAYQRPLSLEETPSRNVDSFLKENKMEGLLSSKAKKKSFVEDKKQEPAQKASEKPAEKEEKAPEKTLPAKEEV